MSGNPTLERARSGETLSDTSSAPRVHVRPMYMTMEVCGASLMAVRRMDKNVRRVCLYRVDVRVATGARLVVSIRMYLSHITDKGLKNEHYRCNPVAVP